MLNEDIIKEFIFDCRMRKLSERTIKSYKNNNLAMMQFIQKEYGIVELEETNHIAIRDYIEFLTKKELAETYINSLMKCFKAYFTYCVREQYIMKNPMERVYKQKEPITLINAFSDTEVKRMINFHTGTRFLQIRNKLIMILLFDTGIRNSELCGLKLDDIRDTYINILGKGKKVRYVPITSIISKQLIKYLRIRGEYIKNKINYETEYLLLSQKGRKLTVETIERIIKSVVKNVM